MSDPEQPDASELARLVAEAGQRTSELVEDLSDEQLVVPRWDVVNPFLWEIGHVSFFYELFYLRELGLCAPLVEGFEDLYDSFTVEHDDRWQLPLPTRDQTRTYVKRVRELVLERLSSTVPDARESYLVQLALRHEDMHAEAFTYMRQTLAYAAPPIDRPASSGGPPRMHRAGACRGDVRVPGGTFRLGAERDAAFVFDNEKWAHEVELEPFEIARAPVTNAEFAAFVEDDGYGKRELWCRPGWQWRQKLEARHPLLWERRGTEWHRRHFDSSVPLEEHAPVSHVSWFEADAWCRWAGRRLPSEAEWECAASAEVDPRTGTLSANKHRFPWGDDEPTCERANLDWCALGHADVGALPDGDSPLGCRQMIGNVWEWTSSDFYPFPGYVVDTPYIQYSAPWFGFRKVLKGGSWATRRRLISNSYRNFFRPERTDIFAGFRTCAIRNQVPIHTPAAAAGV